MYNSECEHAFNAEVYLANFPSSLRTLLFNSLQVSLLWWA